MVSHSQDIDGAKRGEESDQRPEPRLANSILVERTWSPDRKAILAALRIALGLPTPQPGPGRRKSDGI